MQALEKPARPKFDGLYGVCRRVGYCIEECGLCAFIEPAQSPSYKATNQASRYSKKQADGTLFSPETEGITIGYKEPLKPVEDGFGYFGAITVSPDKTCVQCHKCGFYFKLLGQHLREHKMSGRNYKKAYGLAVGTTLMTKSATRDWSKKRPYNYTDKAKEHMANIREKALESIKNSDKMGKDSLSLEYYNKFGICPDQLIDKYIKLKEKLGHPPSYREFAKEHNTGNPRLLMKLFGRWQEVKDELDQISV